VWSYTPLLQYTFMAWCSVKNKGQGQLYLYLCVGVASNVFSSVFITTSWKTFLSFLLPYIFLLDLINLEALRKEYKL